MDKRYLSSVAGIIALLLISTVVVYAFYRVNRNRLTALLIEEKSGKLEVIANNLNRFYQPLARNIEFLAAHDGVRKFFSDRSDADSLTADLILIASAVQGYDQIRLLDVTGQEILRVNRDGDEAHEVPEDKLQDKSNRDYLRAARELAPADVFISRIDLNQENGVVEKPYKEVIRCAKQLFDENQQPVGIIVTNYLGTQFLPKQAGSISIPHLVLLAEDGSVIQGPDTYPKYANLLGDATGGRFGDYFPKAWSSINGSATVLKSRTAEGIFISTVVPAESKRHIAPEKMYLVKCIPAEFLNTSDYNPLQSTLIIPLVCCWLFIGLLGLALIKRQHQQQIAEQMSRQAELLRRSNQELEEFAYVASHDLQEPLRKIHMFGEMLQSDCAEQLSPDGVRYVDVMVDASDRMRTLINDLLTYSRIGSQEASVGPVESQQAFQTALDNLAATIERAGATVKCENPLPVVIADQQQLVRVFQNLIGNAIKYCEQQPVVMVSHKREANHWHFLIADNGIGIDPEYADAVFQVFKRLHKRSKYKGTGIGLAICKRIVERYSGQIWLEPADPQGTVFHFTLPAG